MTDYKIQKPFLKWVGGKTQIIHDIIAKIPKEIQNYHELILGGGSVLLAVLSLYKQNKITIHGRIMAYDINNDLINVYKNIQSNKDELYDYINTYMEEYDSLGGVLVIRTAETLDEAKTSKESYYYWLRNKYNNIDKNTVECSALFMILNKTCFRGMYREGPNGYNVPFGHYKSTPSIISREDLDTISDLIKDVIFIHSDFRESISNVEEDDFMYLDPPYAPENSKSFVGYVNDGFDLEMHEMLFDLVKKSGINFVMSNSNVEMVTDSFKDYEFESIVARRAINSKNPGATAKEVIIYK